MKKSLSNTIILLLVIIALIFFVIRLITDNEIFSGIMFICLGIEFVILHYETRKKINLLYEKVQIFSGLFILAIGMFIIIKNIMELI